MKNKEKIEINQELKTEIKRTWNIRSLEVIPVPEVILKKLKNFIEEPGVLSTVTSTVLLQKTVLEETGNLLRKVLDCRQSLWKWGWGREKKVGKGEAKESIPKNEQLRKNVKV